MKKIIMIVLVVLLGGPVVLILGKDVILKAGAEGFVKSATGLGLRMESISTSLLRGTIRIKALKLFNPDKFADKIMLDMPEIYAHCDFSAFLGHKAHLYELRLDLAQFQVIKNKDGALNLDSLKVIQGQKKEAKTGEKSAPLPVQIDVLELKIGKVVYKDYTGGGNPRVQEFSINLNEKFTDVRDLNALAGIIVFKALANTTIAQLTNFDLGGLQTNFSSTLASAQNVALEAKNVLSQSAKKVLSSGNLEQASAAVKDTAGDLGKAAGKLTGVLNLFGSSDKK